MEKDRKRREAESKAMIQASDGRNTKTSHFTAGSNGHS
jgi:hypothetical protein